MTNILFTERLLSIDLDMKKNCKILMFVENSTAHNNIPHLENIKIKFLPPNITWLRNNKKMLKPCIEKKLYKQY